MIQQPVVLDEIIHQSTRLRVMTLLVSQPEPARVAYTFIQRTLDLTGGNLTIHLRKLREAGYVAVTKEFRDEKPSTWIQATSAGRQSLCRLSGQPARGAEGSVVHGGRRIRVPLWEGWEGERRIRFLPALRRIFVGFINAKGLAPQNCVCLYPGRVSVTPSGKAAHHSKVPFRVGAANV